MKKNIPVKPILISLAVLFLVYSLLGFFAVPLGVKKIARTVAEKELAASFRADAVRFNPYTLELTIQKAAISSGEDAPLLRVHHLLVDLSILSVFKLAPVITGLRIDGPALSLSLDREGKLVLPGTLGALASENHPESTANAPFGFRLSNLAMDHAEVTLTDLKHGLTHKIRELSLTIPKISTLDDEIGNPVKADAGLILNTAKISAAVTGNIFGPEMTLEAVVKGDGMPLDTWLPYVPLPEKLEAISLGILSWNLELGYTGKKGQEPNGAEPVVLVKGRADIKTMTADLKGEGPLARIPNLSVTINTPDLLNTGLRLDLVTLDAPEIFLKRDARGDLTLLSLIDSGNKAESPPKHSESLGNIPGIKVAVNRAAVNTGKIHFQDDAVDNKFQTLVSPLSVLVDNFKLEGKTIAMDFKGSAATPPGEKIRISGSLAQADDGVKKVTGNLVLENGSPETYAAYLAPFTGKVVHLARINAASNFFLALGQDGMEGSIKDGRIRLSKITLDNIGDKKPIIHIPEIDLTGIEADLGQRHLRIGSVATNQGEVKIGINKKGQVNLVQQLDALVPKTKKPSTEKGTAPWQIGIGDIKINDWSLALSDKSHAGGQVNLKLTGMTIHGEDLATKKGAPPGKITGAMKFQNSGKIDIAGIVDLAGQKTRLGVDLTRIEIKAFQPYFTDYLNIDITGGAILAKADLLASRNPGKPLHLKLTGQTGISDFSSKDKETQNDFFKCKSLFFSGMDISLWPLKVNIKDISLTDFYSRAILLKSGQINYRMILVQQTKQKEAASSLSPETGTFPQALEPMPAINVENITLQGGHINFTDLFTTPSYTANMTEIAGSISNLSSTEAQPANVTLKGVHGLYSPLDITGKIKPFGKERMADMALSFKNIELTQFNAYSKKYLGHEIETGKLILNLEYHIRGNRLESSNRLLFDRLNLGPKVESKEATSLPVELAISLLKDSDGQIDLDIPVYGNLEDPRFSFASVAAEAFKNMIVSVVSAPFKALGKLFGGWDSGELGFVEFLPGQDRLDDDSKTKLSQLSKILAKKTKLSFMIQGKFDPDLDTQVLRKDKYRTMLMAAAGTNKDQSEETLLKNPDRRLALVDKVYAAAKFPKPMDEQGNEKKVTPGEKEKLLLTHISVTENELANLAARRSTQIMDYMASEGKVGPQRLFVEASGPVGKEDKSGNKVKTLFQVK